MKYSIVLHPEKTKEWGLNLTEAVIFSFCYELPSWADAVIIEGITMFRGNRRKASEEMGLDLAPDTIYRTYKKLHEKGLIIYSKDGSNDLIALTSIGKTWGGKKSEDSEKNPSKLGKKSESHYIVYKDTSNNISPANAELPPPSDSPQPLKEKTSARDSDGRRAAAVRIVSYLNQKAMRAFPTNERMSKDTIKLIAGRLNEGYTEEQLKLVVDNRCSVWLGDAKISDFLQPSTLFNPSKFVNYFEAATRSSGGYNNGPVYDAQLSSDRKKSYDGFLQKITEEFPNISKSVRFFTASEYLGFFAAEPAFSPKIWSKYQGDMRKSKIRQALTSLENDSQRSRTAPTGLCDYLKQWFIDERDGKH